MLRRFRLEEPDNVQEASQLLGRFGESGKVYAGGTELLLAMKEGLVRYERLIDIKNIRGLDGVKLANDQIHIGSLATHHLLEESKVLQQAVPALVKMERNVANVRVRQVGTLGGNLCFAEPHADPGTLLMVLGAKLVVEKAASKREVPIEKFFVDAYESCLEDDEVLTGIQVPLPAPKTGIAYLKFGYLERPSVGVAVAVHLNGGGKLIGETKIAVGCAGPTPKRVEEAEELLRNSSVEEASHNMAKAGELAAHVADAISDLHGSQDYKEHIVQVLVKRAFKEALSHS
jgi:aerobic carbon-monoxide dehydrogenase medium subunit